MVRALIRDPGKGCLLVRSRQWRYENPSV